MASALAPHLQYCGWIGTVCQTLSDIDQPSIFCKGIIMKKTLLASSLALAFGFSGTAMAEAAGDTQSGAGALANNYSVAAKDNSIKTKAVTNPNTKTNTATNTATDTNTDNSVRTKT